MLDANYNNLNYISQIHSFFCSFIRSKPLVFLRERRLVGGGDVHGNWKIKIKINGKLEKNVQKEKIKCFFFNFRNESSKASKSKRRTKETPRKSSKWTTIIKAKSSKQKRR